MSAAGAVAAAPVKVFTPIIALFTAGSVVPAPLLLPLWVALVVAAWMLLRLVAPVVTVAIDPVSLVPHRRPSLGKPISVAAVGRCASVPAPVPAPVPAAVVPSSPGRRTRASSTAASAKGPFGAVPTRWTIEPEVERGAEGQIRARIQIVRANWGRQGGSRAHLLFGGDLDLERR